MDVDTTPTETMTSVAAEEATAPRPPSPRDPSPEAEGEAEGERDSAAALEITMPAETTKPLSAEDAATPTGAEGPRPKASQWDAQLAEYVAYRAEHGADVRGRTTKLGQWVDVQRSKRKQGKLTDDRIARLDAAGFTWGKPRARPQENVGWDARFDQLAAYQREHGHCNPPKLRERGADDPLRKLAVWVSDQRGSKKRGRLSAERVRRLEDLGFLWETRAVAPPKLPRLPRASQFEMRLADLAAHRREHGHGDVPGATGLGGWVRAQRRLRKKGTLSAARVAALDAAGFEWTPRGADRDAAGGAPPGPRETVLTVAPGTLGLTVQCGYPRGGARIAAVDPQCGFRDRIRAGDRLVTIDGPVETAEDLSLGSDRQREFVFATEEDGVAEAPAGAAAPSDRAPCAEAGDPGSGGEAAGAPPEPGTPAAAEAQGGPARPPRDNQKWEEQFDKLVTYQREYGDCQVPQREGELGKWVKNQRYRKAKGKLDESRVARLEAVGFTWTAVRAPRESDHVPTNPEHEVRWEERFDELRRFGEENGHFKAPKSSHAKLRGWVDKQRHYHKQGTLSESRKARLEAIGFDLGSTVSTQLTLEERIVQLQEYSQQYGDCSDIPLTHPVLGKWAWHQRHEYKRMKLSDERIKRLKAAGFEFKLSFEDRFLQLQQYVEIHGHCNPPQNHVVLGAWVKSIRQAQRNNELPEEQMGSLVDIGFNWSANPPRVAWEHRYEMLRQYAQVAGNGNAPRSHPTLGTWLDNQRRAYKKGKLLPQRVADLERLGVDWGTCKKDPELSWQEQYTQLVEFKQEHGHCNVRQSTKGLGRWVHWQRCVFKTDKLSEERVRRLNEIDFNWGSDASPPVSWESRFNELRQFYNKHGHCTIPRKDDKFASLERWVNNQRCLLEKMSEERRNLLLEIGLTPLGKVREEQWVSNFDKLLAYKDEHGHCNVVSSGSSRDLGKWVEYQRKCHAKGRLSTERARRLRNVGFEFDARAVPDLYLLISSGNHGCMLQFGDTHFGAKIVGIDSTCNFQDKISVGDCIVTIDGKHVTKEEDLIVYGSGTIGVVKNKEQWASNYDKLLAYKDEHGHCNVAPTGSSLDLSKWVEYQRKCHAKGRLSTERVERLRNIGFEFDARAVPDLYLPISSGDHGYMLQFGDTHFGAKIVGIDSTCNFQDKVSVGDCIVTIDGKHVTKEEDLMVDNSGTIGVVKNKETPKKPKKRTTPKKTADAVANKKTKKGQKPLDLESNSDKKKSEPLEEIEGVIVNL